MTFGDRQPCTTVTTTKEEHNHYFVVQEAGIGLSNLTFANSQKGNEELLKVVAFEGRSKVMTFTSDHMKNNE